MQPLHGARPPKRVSIQPYIELDGIDTPSPATWPNTGAPPVTPYHTTCFISLVACTMQTYNVFIPTLFIAWYLSKKKKMWCVGGKLGVGK